jgi:hypothetical protein
MRKSHLDLATDYIVKVLGDVQVFLKDENKNIQPYQSVKVPDEEILARYLSTSQEVKDKFRSENPQAYEQYEGKVLNLIARRQKSG